MIVNVGELRHYVVLHSHGHSDATGSSTTWSIAIVSLVQRDQIGMQIISGFYGRRSLAMSSACIYDKTVFFTCYLCISFCA